MVVTSPEKFRFLEDLLSASIQRTNDPFSHDVVFLEDLTIPADHDEAVFADRLVRALISRSEEAATCKIGLIAWLIDTNFLFSDSIPDANRLKNYESALDKAMQLSVSAALPVPVRLICQYEQASLTSAHLQHVVFSHDRVERYTPRTKAWPLQDAEPELSEWTKSLAALNEMRDFNRLIMDNLPIGIAVNTVEPNVLFQYVNDRFLDIYRIRREDLEREDGFWEAAYEDAGDREKIRRRVLDDCATGDPTKMIWEDIPIFRKNKETTYITAMNIPIPHKNLMISTVMDVTDRKLAQLHLLQSATRLNALFYNSPSAITIFDETGNYIEISKAAAAIIGKPPEELIGRSFTELFAPEIARRFMATLAQIKKDRRTVYKVDTISVNNENRIYESRLFPISGGDGPILFGSIANDITDQRHAQDELRRHERELEALLAISSALRTAQTTGELPYILLDHALSATDHTAGGVWMTDPTDGVMHLCASRGHFPVENDPPFQSGECIYENTDSYTIPIRSDGADIGKLMVIHEPLVQADPQKERLLSSIAEMAGVAVSRIRMFERTQKQLEHLKALSDIDRAINTSHGADIPLRIVLDKVRSQLEADACVLFLIDPVKNVLFHKLSFGFIGDEAAGVVLRFGDCAAGRSAQTRGTVILSDTSACCCTSCPAILSHKRFHCCVSIPMVIKGVLKGVLAINRKDAFKPDVEWTQFAETLAGQAAIAIDNAELYENLQKSNTELEMSYNSTIEGWSRTLDLRDHDTEGHSRRVAEMTVRLAQSAGIPDADLIHIRRGALLHDIGKVGIPDSILLKDGKLDDAEWDLMKKHPQMAYDLLYPIVHLRPSLDIPLYHHEKYDGSGYPKGLMGREIPQSARIFAVVDVFDALTSVRPYRPAWSRSGAIDFMRTQSGIHFDPEALTGFLDLIGE